MSKDDLLAQLQTIPGNPVILTWDPEEGDWAPVTGFTYDETAVKLYTDEP